jgi:hypothetical protein
VAILTSLRSGCYTRGDFHPSQNACKAVFWSEIRRSGVMAEEPEVQEEKKGGGKKRFFLIAMIAGLIAGLMFWRKRHGDDDEFEEEF